MHSDRSNAARHRLDRELTARERQILGALLARSTRARDYREQLDLARPVSRCACGCASISLAVQDRSSADADAGPGEVIADGRGTTRDGRPFDVILFANAGVLRELELVWHEAGAPPAEFPPIECVEDIW